MILIAVAAVGLGIIITGLLTGYLLVTLAGVAVQCIAIVATCWRFWKFYRDTRTVRRVFRQRLRDIIDVEFKEVK